MAAHRPPGAAREGAAHGRPRNPSGARRPSARAWPALTAHPARAGALRRIALQVGHFSAILHCAKEKFSAKRGRAGRGPPPNHRSGLLPTDVREQRIRAG